MAKNTRERLLDYTYLEIEKYGYFQASTSDILKKCKIPKGSMYHYFSSKHHLTLCVIDERVRTKTLKKYHVKVQESPLESLIDFLQAIDFSKKTFRYGCVMHKLTVEMAHLDAEFQEVLSAIFDEVLAHFTEVITASIKAGEIKSCDAKEKANYILTSLLGAISLKNERAVKTLIKELRSLKPLKKQTNAIKQQTLF